MSAPGPGGGPQHSGEPAAQLFVDPVEVTPGVAVDVSVGVLNLGKTATGFRLAVRGLEPEWVALPSDVGPLEPGQRGEAVVRLRLPPAHPPSQLVATITARPIIVPYDWAASPGDGAAPRPALPARPGQADLSVTVGNGNLIGAALEPAEVHGTFWGRFEVVLRNRGRAPLRVDLFGRAAEPGVGVEFASGTAVLAPGEEARVRSRIHGPRPVVGQPRRRPFNVRVQGRGSPVLMEGSFTQRPVFPAWLIKAVAIVCVVALWVSVAAVGISALGKHINKTAAQKSVANAPPLPAPNIPGSGAAKAATSKAAASNAKGAAAGAKSKAKGALLPGPTSQKASAPSTSSTAGSEASGSGSAGAGSASTGGARSGGSTSGGGSGSGGSGGGSGSGGSGSGNGGSGAAGASGSGGSGSSSGGTGAKGGSGSATGSAASAATAGVVKGARVSGRLASPQPGGVTVTIAPTSLVSASSQDANLTSSTFGGRTSGGAYEVAEISPTASKAPIGKVYGTVAGASFNAALTAATTPTQTTTTAPDGTWAFAGLRAPDEYLVTFSKAGYQTAKYIVTTANANSKVTLSATLAAGHGLISGTVLGPGGPLGDANISITDGRVTASTKTPTVGSVGSWSVSGLSTPDTFLVTATAPGFAAQTALVKLGAGGTDKGVSLTLQPGEGTITGTVTDSQTGAGVGGVKVTASSGKFTLSATTTTVSPIGSYTLPNLPIPGSYTVTVSGIGWVSQTQQVQLSGNPVVNASLTPSSGDVNGVALSSAGGGLAGAGVILANDKNTFKTLTESAAPVGGFDFGQVPPGHYVLTIEDFGFTTQSAQVTVVDGTTQTVDLTLPFVGSTSENTATIQGSVSDFLNATPIAGARLTLDGKPAVVATTTAGGTYQISGVGPGEHTVTAVANNYEPASVQVSVTLGGVAFAPPILLPIEDEVGGVVLSNAGGVVPDPQVQLVDPATGAVVASTTSPPSVPTLSGVPAPSLGGFQVDQVPHGNYLMKISAPPSNGCGTEAYVPSQTPVSVSLGTNVTLVGSLSPALDQAPSFNVVTLEASSSSLPTQVGGVRVTVSDTRTGQATTCSSPSPPTAQGATPTDLTFPSLVQGDPYRADFTLTSGGTTITAPPVTFKGTLNNSAVDSVVLAAHNPEIDLSLQYPYRTPQEPDGSTGAPTDCPIQTLASAACPTLPAADLPTVQMTGTVGYNFPTPGQPSAPILQTFTATPPTDGSNVWKFPAADIQSLLPSSVTFTVSDPGTAFEQFTKTDNTADNQFNTQHLLLTPAPAPSPLVLLTPQTGVTVVTVPPIAGLNLLDANGSVSWQDSNSASPGSVEPGYYTLNFSADHYDPTTCTVTVPFQGATSPAQAPASPQFPACPTSVALVPHVSLVVTPTSPGFTTSSGLAFPTVSLADANGPIGTPITLNANQPSATFPDLSVADTTLVVTVRQPGYKTLTQAVHLSVTPSLSDDLPVTLQEEGWLTGTVEGQINATTSPLAGVQMQATLVAGANCGSTTSLVATTDANGHYLITGDPATANGGLCVGGIYVVGPANQTPPAGYAGGTVVVLIGVAGANTAPPLVLHALQITETVVVTDSTTGLPITGATVIGRSGVGVSPVLATPGTTPGDYELTIDPTSYTFEVDAPLYNSLTVGPIPFAPSSSTTGTTVDVSLTPTDNEITGTLTVAAPSGQQVPVSGVTVSLIDENGLPGTVLATATSASDGTYTFSAENANGHTGVIPNGNYLLSATPPGYSYFAQPQVFATATPIPGQLVTTTVENLEIQASRVSILVSATSTLPETSIIGATISLTPLSPPDTTLTCFPGTSPLLVPGLGVTQQLTLEGPTSLFTNVEPDYYTVNVAAAGAPSEPAENLLVCPGGLTFTQLQVQEGQISGTVTAADGVDPSTASVSIFTGTTATGTAVATPSISCVTGPCDYSAILPLGTAYTVQVSLRGFTTQTEVTPVLTASAPSTSFSPALVPQNHTVHVTVQSTSTPPVPAPSSAVVTMATLGGTPFTAVPDPSTPGQFDFSAIPPSPSADYTVSATFAGFDFTATLQVPIEPTTADPITLTITGDFGTISGTVTAQGGGSTANAQVSVFDAATGTPIATSTGGSYGPTFVNLGTAYTVQVSLAGYVTQTSTLTPNATNPTPTFSPVLVPETHTVDLTLESNDAANPVLVPSTATVTLTSSSGTYHGSPTSTAGQFEFTGVIPGSYTATAQFAGLNLNSVAAVVVPVASTVTVNPAAAQFDFGELSGTVTLSAEQATDTTVTVELCTTKACNGTPQTVASVTITAGTTSGQYSQFLTAGTTGFLAFAATGFTAPAPVSVTVADIDLTGPNESPTLTAGP